MADEVVPQFSLRPAADDDLNSILEIERVCYQPPCVPWTEAAFRAELGKPFSNVVVLTDDETDSIIAGYVVFWLNHDETYILNIAVHPEWRGLGFAERMARMVINASVQRDAPRIFLEVRKNNDAAVGLYQKLGFFIDHIKPRFYENGDDAYFMVRLLRERPGV